MLNNTTCESDDKPQIIKFHTEGDKLSIVLNEDDINNMLNSKMMMKVSNLQTKNKFTVISNGLDKCDKPKNVETVLDGCFSDGSHIWKCCIMLSSQISTFIYNTTSQNFRINETVNLIPKYDGGFCKFTVNPDLPNGLSIDENTGIISGVCLCESNKTTYTVMCKNNTSQNQVDLTLSVGVLTKFSYSKKNVLIGLNTDFCFKPEFDGDNCEFTSTPNLPYGLYLDPQTGIISGKVNFTQDTTKYIIKCKNNTAKMYFQLNLTVISLTQFDYKLENNTKRFLLNELVELEPIFDSINCSFTIDKELPNGLSFDSNTGKISGRCSELSKQEEYTITCNNGFSSLQYTLKLSIGDLTTFTYPKYLIKAKKGEYIELIPNYDGEMCSFSILEGNLFEGLELNPTNGIINGKCDCINKAKEFTIICSNSTGFLDYKITLSIGELSLFKYDKSVVEINKLEEIHLTPEYEGDDCEFSVNQKLPFGLILDKKTGEITGICKKDKEKSDYIITCDNGIDKLEFTLQITVSSISFIKYEQNEFILHINDEYIFEPIHDGFNCKFSSDPELPDGLSLDENTGIISGKCLTTQDSKEYVICCENDYNTEICTIKISIGVLTKFEYPKYDIYLNCGEDMEMIPACDGDECEFSVEPELPNGITLNTTNGVISGKSDCLQLKKCYEVKCIDMINISRVKTYKIYITIGEITSFIYPTYDYHFSTDNKNIEIIPKELIGSKCNIYSIPDLPNGLTINNENGIISGECNEILKDKLFTIICKNDISQRDYGIHITTVEPITYFRYMDDKYRYYGIINDDIHIKAEYDGSDCKFYIAPEYKLPTGLYLDESSGDVDGKFEEIVDDLRCKIICENEFSKRDYILEFDVSSDCMVLPCS